MEFVENSWSSWQNLSIREQIETLDNAHPIGHEKTDFTEMRKSPRGDRPDYTQHPANGTLHGAYLKTSAVIFDNAAKKRNTL